MNKAELIEKVEKRAKCCTKAEAQRAVEAVIDTIKEELGRGGEVAIGGFGTFLVKQRAARKARNPKTGETIQVPAKKVPKFKPGKGLKEAVK